MNCLLTLMLFQTCMNFFHLWGTKGYFSSNIIQRASCASVDCLCKESNDQCLTFTYLISGLKQCRIFSFKCSKFKLLTFLYFNKKNSKLLFPIRFSILGAILQDLSYLHNNHGNFTLEVYFFSNSKELRQVVSLIQPQMFSVVSDFWMNTVLTDTHTPTHRVQASRIKRMI